MPPGIVSNLAQTYYNAGMRKLWRSVLDKMEPYDGGRPLEQLAAELGLSEVIRLSANENPLGPSPQVVRAVTREATRIHLYPDGGARELREAIGRRLGVAPSQIIVGNGADELLALIAWAAFEPGDEIVVPHPCFEPYTTVSMLAGADVRLSPLVDYHTDLDDMRQRVNERTKAVVLCSPHNPAGTIIRRSPLRGFLAALEPDAPLVVLDEAYRDFCDDRDYPDGVELLSAHPSLVILRTFSKVAALAGLRVGYAVASSEVIDRLNRVRAPYNVNRLGQVAARAALDDPDHLERTRRLVIQERRFLSEELARRGYACPPSQANFLLVRVGPDASTKRERLLRAGILVRDGEAVGFPEHLRITVGTREINERLLATLASEGV
jgi:histidinol-phosphate aminotransferase